jgi:hypothetical protein
VKNGFAQPELQAKFLELAKRKAMADSSPADYDKRRQVLKEQAAKIAKKRPRSVRPDPLVEKTA